MKNNDRVVREIKRLSLREIERMEQVLSEMEVLEDSSVVLLARSYFSDSKTFFDKREYVNAFEAIIICWAYVDSLLHFGKIRISDERKDLFTV